MIKFADEHTKPLVRQMWKICFGDSDEFLDIHFTYKYKNENTLIYFEGDIAVASLQMLPYTITFYQEKVPFAYLAGLCTLPEYRKRGYMDKLIRKAHRILVDRNIPLSILIPAEDWLFHFYEKYGYEQVFEQGKVPIYPLKKILDTHPTLKDAYTAFNVLSKDRDFCVQKDFMDFEAIIKEQAIDGFPDKYNLEGMACIIDEPYLLSLYAKSDPSLEMYIKVINKDGSGIIYKVSHRLIEVSHQKYFDVQMDTLLLCRLLFGYKVDEMGEPYKSLFSSHDPVMNLMME